MQNQAYINNRYDLWWRKLRRRLCRTFELVGYRSKNCNWCLTRPAGQHTQFSPLELTIGYIFTDPQNWKKIKRHSQGTYNEKRWCIAIVNGKWNYLQPLTDLQFDHYRVSTIAQGWKRLIKFENQMRIESFDCQLSLFSLRAWQSKNSS